MQLIQQLPDGTFSIDDPFFDGRSFDSYGEAESAAAARADALMAEVEDEMDRRARLEGYMDLLRVAEEEK